MRVTIISDNLAAQGKPYKQGKHYELTPHLAGLFIARGWAKEHREKRGKKPKGEK